MFELQHKNISLSQTNDIKCASYTSLKITLDNCKQLYKDTDMSYHENLHSKCTRLRVNARKTIDFLTFFTKLGQMLLAPYKEATAGKAIYTPR